MTLDPDCVSVRIDNSTASANRRPKIRLLVRSVLNSEVCMFFFIVIFFFVVFFTFLLLSFFFFLNIWNPEQHAGMLNASYPLIFVLSKGDSSATGTYFILLRY